MMKRIGLELTKEQGQSYINPVLRRIYGLSGNDIKLVNNWLNSQEGDLFVNENLESDLTIRKIDPPNGYKWNLEFKVDPMKTIVGVLPNTVFLNPYDISYIYSLREKDIYPEILARLDQFERSACGMEKVQIFQPYPMTGEELDYIVMRLVRENKLSKYFKVNDKLYLVVYKKWALYFNVVNGVIKLKEIGDLMFDIDDGFISGDEEVRNKLNQYHIAWLKLGEINTPVIPTNII